MVEFIYGIRGAGIISGGGGTFFLMNFELLTFLCLQINDQTYHTYTTCFQNESIYIRKTHVLCDACIVCI